ncbi:MAG: YMGG-like glycine zipper-containing protein [Sedimentisphaerales bacterium]
MRTYIGSGMLILVLAVVGIIAVGCETQAQSGALIGSGVGAGVGALAGRGSAEGTLIGAAVGGGAGYIVGNEGDKKQQQQQMQQQQQNSVLINIHNSNGSVSTVRVNRSGIGYVGPRGEYYDHLPTEAELRPVYGF